ncbi:hypothetical protein [Flagellimonas halotolerans]|uniref:Helix-turn-helix domain-containing protein n=1 Tax=Flagellimonas halotolerans TaxID=3112164 RepID=A0ABU6IMB0_9FLAO|nr:MULTISPECIES: hypothetical protein [unclassified Allomuricauda]MEC3964284.1 hypothetical protein [Muricauda sp. SYSU M86414]MEC4264154.1 hypothetical protein [Muricauda sp. SYSU M84420]
MKNQFQELDWIFRANVYHRFRSKVYHQGNKSIMLEYIRLHNQLLKIMANKTLGMQKVRQILLFLKRAVSERSIAEQTGVSRPTIHSCRGIFETSGFDYDTLLKLKDAELYELVKTKKKGPDRTPDVRKLYFLEQADYFLFCALGHPDL